MARPFDHLVLAVHDLGAAAEFYRRLGFLVSQRNRHPWGTENHIIQFDGAFLELIGLGADFVPPAKHDPKIFSFAGFVADYLRHQQGLAMLVLRSADAKADQAAFREAAIGSFEVLYFARKARMPDGREVDVAFSLAFAETPALPDAGFFVCQHHFPQNFWNPAFQVHPNGARGVAGVVMIADFPADHAAFFSTFAGVPRAQVRRDGLAVDTGFGRIDVVSPAVFGESYGGAAQDPAKHNGHFVMMRLAMENLDNFETMLQRAAISFAHHGERLVVAPLQAFGCAIVCEQAAAAG